MQLAVLPLLIAISAYAPTAGACTSRGLTTLVTIIVDLGQVI